MNQGTTLDFTMKEKLIVLKGKMNNVPRTFIFDSGAPNVILNRKYQERSEYEKYEGRELKGVTGSISKFGQLKIDSLCCAGVEKRNVTALVLDLNQIEQTIQEEVYGLIGYDFFREYNVYLDYQLLKLGLWKDEECDEFLSQEEHGCYPFRLEKHLPIITCKIGKTSCQFAIDTGANTNLVDMNLQEALKDNMDIIDYKASIVGANTEAARSTYMVGRMRNLNVEGLGSFLEMDAVFSDLSHLNQNTTNSIHGLLGYEFLSQQKTIISFTKHKLYVVKRTNCSQTKIVSN